MFNALKKAGYGINQNIVLYHGTSNIKFKPDYNYVNTNNDYGGGLYLTPDLELAKEWSFSKYNKTSSGYVFEIILDTSRLSILNIDEYDIIYWLTIILSYRKIKDVTPRLKSRIEVLQSKYFIDLSSYDIIKGWRADDAFFRYVKDFILSNITIEDLKEAIKFGNLGIQYCLKSEKAFNSIISCELKCTTDKSYRDKFNKRDSEAINSYKSLLEHSIDGDDIFTYIK